MPHFLAAFTMRKITKATMMKVINATKKGPTSMNGLHAPSLLLNQLEMDNL